jgi:hypothetical protein
MWLRPRTQFPGLPGGRVTPPVAGRVVDEAEQGEAKQGTKRGTQVFVGSIADQVFGGPEL